MKPVNLSGRMSSLNFLWMIIPFALFGCHTARDINERPHVDATITRTDLPRQGLNFLVLGDWGRKGEHHQQEVAAQMGAAASKMRGDFIVTTGDNFYTKVRSVDDSAWQESFEDVYTAESLQVPWYVSLGNHDYKGDVQAQIDYSSVNGRWMLPERYYTIEKPLDDTTCAQLIFLDTTPLTKLSDKKKTPLNSRAQRARAQLRWLDRTLATSICKWKIVIGHHPVYAAGSRHGRIRRMVTHLQPILEKYGVQAYFSGHEHDLQYLKRDGPVNYFISGAGSKAHRVHHQQRALFSAGVSGFMAVSLTGQHMSVFFVDYRGNVLYRGDIQP